MALLLDTFIVSGKITTTKNIIIHRRRRHHHHHHQHIRRHLYLLFISPDPTHYLDCLPLVTAHYKGVHTNSS